MATSPIVFGDRTTAAPRHPLGLPAGSVRAILTLMVLGLIWSLMLLPGDLPIPIYLYYLMFLILGHFFAAHGHSIAGPKTGSSSPLYLPRGTLRTVIVLGFFGVLGWRYYQHRDWEDLLKLQEPLLQQPYLPVVLVGAFFLGVFMSRVVGRLLSGPRGVPSWYQDIQAWVALLGALGLGIDALIHLVINPGLEPEQRLLSREWQMAVASIIAFYFGARS